MNTFGAILALAVVCMVSAEPQFRARFLSQRQQSEATTEWDTGDFTTESAAPYAAAGFKPEQEFNLPTNTDANETDEEEGREQTTGPYPPSGWQPSGRLLNLPNTLRQRQVQEPISVVYGQPAFTTESSYDQTTTTAEASNEFESNETTDEPDSELLPNSALLNSKLVNAKLQKQRSQMQVEGAAQAQPGAYYLNLAGGASQPLLYYQSNVVSGPVAARFQVQPQSLVQVPQSAALIQPAQRAQFLQTSQALIQPSRSAAFVQAPLAQPQYYINPYVFPNAVSYSSQYQSSW